MLCRRVSRTGRLESAILLPPRCALANCRFHEEQSVQRSPAKLPLVFREEYAQRIGEPVHRCPARARLMTPTRAGCEEALPHGGAPPAQTIANASKDLAPTVQRPPGRKRLTGHRQVDHFRQGKDACELSRSGRACATGPVRSKAERSAPSNGSRPLVPSSRPNAPAASPFSIASELRSATITRANSTTATNTVPSKALDEQTHERGADEERGSCEHEHSREAPYR